MQTYITQLLEDLTEAAKTKIEAPDYKLLYPDHPAIDYDLDGLIAYQCAPRLPFSDIFNIQDEVFPPVEKLTNEQASDICEAIMNLWQVNHLQVDLPSDTNIPVANLYNELITYWKEDGIQLMPIDGGTIHLDFCTYFEESCPWGSENCTCEETFRRDAEAMEKFKAEQKNKSQSNTENDEDLPF